MMTMSDDSKYSEGGEYHDSSREVHNNEPLFKHSINRKYGRKATEFPQAKNWIRVDWDSKIPSTDRIHGVLIDALRHKILGMNSIVMYLFTPESRRHVIIPPREYRRINDYGELGIVERTQAYKFWRRVKIYANRRKIPYTKRIYGGIKYTKIDVLNYRINSVGNRLKKHTLKTMGRGINFFDGTQVIHSIPTLDVAEIVRPLLYLVVLRSLSLPMDNVKPIVDRIIADGMRWVMNRVELLSDQDVIRYRINYHEYCKRINNEISELELQVLGLHSKHKVTASREPGIIEVITRTKEIKAGERIHRQLLSEFAQPLSLDRSKIMDSDYLHILSEVKISSIMGNLEGRVDLMVVNNKPEILIIVDVKTYEGITELHDSHRQQVNTYLDILEENDYSINNTIRSVIHVHRKNVPDSIKPVIDWILKHRELLLRELESSDIRGVINPDNFNNSSKKSKKYRVKAPTLKEDSIRIHDTQPEDTGYNLLLSMWSY